MERESRRRSAARRIIVRMEVETTQADEQQAKDAKEYVARVEADLQKICGGILAQMGKNLIPLVEGVVLQDEG